MTNSTLVCHCLKQWQILKNKKIVIVFNSDKLRFGLSLFKTVTKIKTKKIVTVLSSDKSRISLLLFKIVKKYQWQIALWFVTVLNSDKYQDQENLSLFWTVTNHVLVCHCLKQLQILVINRTLICHCFKQWQFSWSWSLSLFKTVTNQSEFCHCSKQWQFSYCLIFVTVLNSDKPMCYLSLFKTMTI